MFDNTTKVRQYDRKVHCTRHFAHRLKIELIVDNQASEVIQIPRAIYVLSRELPVIRNT